MFWFGLISSPQHLEKAFGEDYMAPLKNLTRSSGTHSHLFVCTPTHILTSHSLFPLFSLSPFIPHTYHFLLSSFHPQGWPRVTKMDAITYYLDIQNSKFNFAPVGAAIDSHRAWESLMLGTIPILYDTTLNPVFDGLPALILRNITQATPSFLHRTYRDMREREYEWERLFGFYWIMRVRRATYAGGVNSLGYSYRPSSAYQSFVSFFRNLFGKRGFM